ncbi:uncharacterized protein LOC132757397, partial [Ruditapes philippinarum]|uniref:uncharacterized protein LOC132757397 n=1 Tax=Ruditapes philippinarum TaxID=129788 RepID=UPI00295BC28A
HMMCDVLPHLSDLSKAMQEILWVSSKFVLSVLQGLMMTPGVHFEAAPDGVAALKGFSITVPTPDQVIRYKEQVYTPFIHRLITNLEERFPDLSVLQLFDVFDTTKFPNGDLGNHGENEIKVCGALHGTDQNADKAMEWITNLHTSHQHLYKLAAVGLLLPPSTADCERGFSSMKRIKLEKRASLKSTVLNALMMLSMEGPPLEAVDFSEMVDTWYKEKPRRIEL